MPLGAFRTGDPASDRPRSGPPVPHLRRPSGSASSAHSSNEDSAEDPCHSNRIFSFFTYSISAVAKLRDHISGRELELLQQRSVSRVVEGFSRLFLLWT